MARILVIDDDDQLRVMMCEVLIRAGHDVSEAANGAEGLAVFRRRPTDLVVTDIFMPEADGFEVILILHRDAPTLPILAVSGGTTRMRLGEEYIGSILRTALRFGASHALRKPFKGQQFLGAVEALLTRDPKRHRTTYPSEVHHPTESLPSFLDGAGQKRGTPGPAHQHEESMPSGIDESGHFLNDTNDHGPRSRADSSCEPDGTDASDTAAADLLKECSDAVSESAPSITDRPVGSDILARLTVKERHVVEALCAGTTVPRMARATGRSPRTVRNQLRSVYRKLGIHSQVELLARLRRG